ncbi:hypothetical protein QW131_31050 [Roseibium salinum]|nr:hypothetical protein [Roseibium salinum]
MSAAGPGEKRADGPHVGAVDDRGDNRGTAGGASCRLDDRAVYPRSRAGFDLIGGDHEERMGGDRAARIVAFRRTAQAREAPARIVQRPQEVEHRPAVAPHADRTEHQEEAADLSQSFGIDPDRQHRKRGKIDEMSQHGLAHQQMP